MIDHYKSQPAVVLLNKQESTDSRLLRLKLEKGQSAFNFIHGQFMMVGLPGFGDAPFDICSNPFEKKKYFEVSVRAVGELTNKLHQVKKGEEVLVRGPFGNGFPHLKELGNNFLMIGGGCGAVTLRSILEEVADNRYKSKPNMQVFWGCADEATILFKNRLAAWKKISDLIIILEKPGKSWKGDKGLVTKLFDEKEVLKPSKVIMCGPPIMYKFVIQKLKEHGFADKDIYLSLERRMYCGTGVCQHCAIGPYYVCKDGPVFRYDKIKDIKGAI